VSQKKELEKLLEKFQFYQTPLVIGENKPHTNKENLAQIEMILIENKQIVLRPFLGNQFYRDFVDLKLTNYKKNITLFPTEFKFYKHLSYIELDLAFEIQNLRGAQRYELSPPHPCQIQNTSVISYSAQPPLNAKITNISLSGCLIEIPQEISSIEPFVRPQDRLNIFFEVDQREFKRTGIVVGERTDFAQPNKKFVAVSFEKNFNQATFKYLNDLLKQPD
jgi:hypothetical protein